MKSIATYAPPKVDIIFHSYEGIEGIEHWPCIPRVSSLVTEHLEGTKTQNKQKIFVAVIVDVVTGFDFCEQ